MNKNDKIIAVIGVIVLVVAAIGVYTWQPSGIAEDLSSIDTYLSITSSFSEIPHAIAVSDGNPFFPLIATPLAVHYDAEANQEVIPLYVQNFTNPSRAITRAMNEQIGIPVDVILDDRQTAEAWSIYVATKYWSKSDAALLIQNDEMGYTLGVMATPLASYLSIPVFITNGTTTSVQSALDNLGVKMTIVCGDTVKGFGKVLRFTDIDNIVDASASLIEQKFEEVKYLTITNPKDAWPPEILESTKYTLGPKTMNTMATTELLIALRGGDSLIDTYTIPEDYKYALIKFKGINMNPENVDDLGDNVIFFSGPMLDDIPAQLQKFEAYAGGTAMGGIPVRDSTGRIIEDITYNEAVVYDRGGVTYQVLATPQWLATNQGQVKVEVTIEKLNDSIYPTMKGLSSIAPYLTAYHKGLIYGKPEFAFAANDDTLYLGEPCPGFYMPRRNPKLVPSSNAHVFWIHEQINELLAKLADITFEKQQDLEILRDYYKDNPLYIALVGDGTVLPQIIYNSSIEPVSVERTSYFWGGGIPSDFIYGNIDPNPGDWSNRAKDLYSDNENHFPYQENIIGRITGWDVQDASALVARTIYYSKIIDDLGEWKRTAVVQLGGGNDFQKPFLRYKIFGEILGVVAHGDPMKVTTGASVFNGLAITDTVESLGFDTTYVRENEAGFQGYSNEAIQKLKTANLLNRFLMSKRQIRNSIGEQMVQGKTLQENSNFILANAHGQQHLFTMGDVGVNSLGLGLPNGILNKILQQVSSIFGYGPGYALADHMYYSPRNVENMNLGPSFLWIESCICGKFDGVYPPQSITQTYLHAGCNAIVASTTTSNIPGGYLEPKNTLYDFPGQALIRSIQWAIKARQGIYPEQHFGFKVYLDTLNQLKQGSRSIGEAFRNARNVYLPEDADWEVWWSPPLVYTGVQEFDVLYQNDLLKQTAAASGLDPRLDNKFQTFFEYHVFGDPAFIPYIPD
ncbi:hypothetical protein AYK25_07250 [Thermoplasmatales archaeon SM1-50]|nr:MAG: hypothetical protein AYK25_07250 [Thermoplasmatales archaeon SM1-50]